MKLLKSPPANPANLKPGDRVRHGKRWEPSRGYRDGADPYLTFGPQPGITGMDKLEAKKNAARARSIAQAMRAQGDHLTSLKSAVTAWEREAERFEQAAK